MHEDSTDVVVLHMNTSSTIASSFSFESIIRNCALIAGMLVLMMLGIYLTTGIGQDPLQFIHSTEEYTDILLRNPPVLKFAIGLDNAFIMFYETMFLALGVVLWRDERKRVLVFASMILLGTVALLDLIENMHFLTMLSLAEHGLPIGVMRISLQVWESLIKFHISYLGLFLLGFSLPVHSKPGMILGFLFRWIQLPVGLLIYLTPPDIARPLVIVRFAFFFVTLILLAWMSRQRVVDLNALA